MALWRCVLTMMLASAGAAYGQSEYTQGRGQAGPTGPVSANGAVSITSFAPPGRIDVRTSASDPVITVYVEGFRNMACTSGNRNWPDSLRQQLFDRISAQNSTALRATLESARAGSREEQYQRLFGVELPHTQGSFYDPTARKTAQATLDGAQQTQLNMGQSVVLQIADPGLVHIRCLTLPEVDAVIAEAKRVYAAVLAAMEGRSPASPGIKPQ